MALARNAGNTKSRANSSLKSSIYILLAPVLIAFSFSPDNSSFCPKSAAKQTTSHLYVSISQRTITDVSKPPEYAKTTLLIFPDNSLYPPKVIFLRLLFVHEDGFPLHQLQLNEDRQ